MFQKKLQSSESGDFSLLALLHCNMPEDFKLLEAWKQLCGIYEQVDTFLKGFLTAIILLSYDCSFGMNIAKIPKLTLVLDIDKQKQK